MKLIRECDDDTCQRFGSLSLGNLDLSSSNHQPLIDCSAIASLIPLTISDDLETRRCVAFGFHNIAANELNHRKCDKMGVLDGLVVLLASDEQNTLLHA